MPRIHRLFVTIILATSGACVAGTQTPVNTITPAEDRFFPREQVSFTLTQPGRFAEHSITFTNHWEQTRPQDYSLPIDQRGSFSLITSCAVHGHAGATCETEGITFGHWRIDVTDGEFHPIQMTWEECGQLAASFRMTVNGRVTPVELDALLRPMNQLCGHCPFIISRTGSN